MAPVTSHLQETLSAATPDSRHALPLVNLAEAVAYNLRYEHNWTDVHIHFTSPVDPSQALPRPLLSGVPHTRIYVHPDEQIENLAREKRGEKVEQVIEREWVLPSHLREKWSLRRFAQSFDAVNEAPPAGDAGSEALIQSSVRPRRGGKRMLLATLGDDSTVVYYVIHDGIVKPRQN